MKHNNQIVVGDHGRREVGEEVQQVGGAQGKRDTIVWAEIQMTKKQNIIHPGLRWPLID